MAMMKRLNTCLYTNTKLTVADTPLPHNTRICSAQGSSPDMANHAKLLA